MSWCRLGSISFLDCLVIEPKTTDLMGENEWNREPWKWQREYNVFVRLKKKYRVGWRVDLVTWRWLSEWVSERERERERERESMFVRERERTSVMLCTKIETSSYYCLLLLCSYITLLWERERDKNKQTNIATIYANVHNHSEIFPFPLSLLSCREAGFYSEIGTIV